MEHVYEHANRGCVVICRTYKSQSDIPEGSLASEPLMFLSTRWPSSNQVKISAGSKTFLLYEYKDLFINWMCVKIVPN